MSSAVVVGAGIIGLATAWQLKRRGWDITVCDPAPVSGATRAAAGMLAPVAEVVWDQPTLYPLMVASGEMFPRFVSEIAADLGQHKEEIGYLANSTFVLAGDSADRTALFELTSLQHRLDMDVQPITIRHARQLEPALGPGCVGAVDIPGDHQVDPRNLCQALLDVIADDLIETTIEKVIFDAQRAVGVHAEDGRDFLADKVIVATGLAAADIGGLPKALNLPLRPVHGEVIRLRVPEHIRPLVRRTIRAVVHGRPVYVVPRADGTVVVGATSREDSLAGVSAEGVYQLLRDAAHIVPSILECEIYEIISKARPGTPDDVPLIGEVAENLILSTGYFRHGILLSALGSHIGALIAVGEEDKISAEFRKSIDPWRFSLVPYESL
ncbi:glycine oxidase ThiO [Corynebacterium poyangense]|uniref:glycine oxidase n=1 Tax=Corynebacterium poyangense TaxID=2684405 RepID=A0A7H0SNJ5_9CORY|nr:glycine oxidase ThiO [Corynebacterium poyangense]MBZ8177153.1 glycine oxidase ThiO [Corynebacterium poyangense]QNQ90120.1 glycine oxidase ThiO [Corynebacterium poyangense]